MQTDLVIQLGCAPHGVRQALGEVGHLSSAALSSLSSASTCTRAPKSTLQHSLQGYIRLQYAITGLSMNEYPASQALRMGQSPDGI